MPEAYILDIITTAIPQLRDWERFKRKQTSFEFLLKI